MPYVLNGTRTLINYWHILGKPCRKEQIAEAVKVPKILFQGTGRDTQSLVIQYGQKEAENLAAALGVTVSDVTDNGGQVLI